MGGTGDGINIFKKLLKSSKSSSSSSSSSFPTRKQVFISFMLIVGIGIFSLTHLSQKAAHYKSFSLLRFRLRGREGGSEKISHFCSQGKKESINWNSFYYYENTLTKQSLVWCKVPKAASTTLTKLFLRLAGVKEAAANGTRIHKLLRNFYPRASPSVMKARIKGSKTFLVVRDPFERILSAYRDKLESIERDLEYRDGYYYDHYGRFMVSNKGTRDNSTVPPTWPEFVRYLISTSVARYDEHWMPITRLCSPCSVHYDAIIRMENFGEIKKTLSWARIESTTTTLGVSHRTGSGSRKMLISYFKNLTLADVKKLYGKYRRDFQLFGYSPYKYFKLFSGRKGGVAKTPKIK